MTKLHHFKQRIPAFNVKLNTITLNWEKQNE